jgi:hypothetical protein
MVHWAVQQDIVWPLFIWKERELLNIKDHHGMYL